MGWLVKPRMSVYPQSFGVAKDGIEKCLGSLKVFLNFKVIMGKDLKSIETQIQLGKDFLISCVSLRSLLKHRDCKMGKVLLCRHLMRRACFFYTPKESS